MLAQVHACSIVLLMGILCGCTPLPDYSDWRENQQKPHRQRFEGMKIGMSEAEVQHAYGPPTVWIYHYDGGAYEAGYLTFRPETTGGCQSLQHSRPAQWPVTVGMTRQEVTTLMGVPKEACAGDYYREGCAHYFCFRDGRLVRKERSLPPLV